MIKAVLFDMDGTLVDTENLDNTIAIEICKNLGFKLTKEEQAQRHGRTTKSFYEYLSKKRNAQYNSKEVIESHLAYFEKELKKGVKSFPGVQELLKLLALNNYTLALVSGSTKTNIDIVLHALDISALFKVIVSADNITHSKPNPEGYLLAAESLNVLPEECVVVEDSVKGVVAGKSANMKVIGVIHIGGQDLSKADIIVNSLREINIEMLHTL